MVLSLRLCTWDAFWDVLGDILLTDITKLNGFIIAFILHALKHFCFDVVKARYLAYTNVLLCNLGCINIFP